MAEEQNSVPAGQQSEQKGAPAGTEAQTTPAGSTNEQTSEQQDDIRNPAAFYQAQAQKWERLFKKAEEERTSLEQRVSVLDQSTKDSVTNDFEALKAEIAQEREAAQAELMQAKRLTAAVEAGLPKAAAKFLTGATDEEIAAQVEELRGMFPAGGSGQSTSRVGAPDAGGSELTMDAINQMSPQEIRSRWDEVKNILAANKKK